MKDQLKQLIEKRLRNAKVRESEIDIKVNPTWCANWSGRRRECEDILNIIDSLNLTSSGSFDLSNGLDESFEPNGKVAFMNGLPNRLGKYDLSK